MSKERIEEFVEEFTPYDTVSECLMEKKRVQDQSKRQAQ